MTEDDAQPRIWAAIARKHEADATAAETTARKAAVELETAELVREHIRKVASAAELPPIKWGGS